MHGEVEGVLPHGGDRAAMEIPRSALAASRWSYIALGHYHVHQRIEDNVYYSGSLEYTSTDPWSELEQEAQLRLPGKGFIEYDLETAEHTFHHMPASRALVSLDSIAARGMSAAELDIAIRRRVLGLRGWDRGEDRAPRRARRAAPHRARARHARAARAEAARACTSSSTRAAPIRRVRAAIGGGRRPTLVEMVTAYLQRRPLDEELDRAALVQLGLEYLKQADEAEAAAAAVAEGIGAPQQRCADELSAARRYADRFRFGAHWSHRRERIGKDDDPRGDRVGDLRHERSARHAGIDSPQPRRRARDRARGARLRSGRTSIPRGARTHERGALPRWRVRSDRELDQRSDRAAHAPPRHDARGVLQHVLHRAERAERDGGNGAVRARTISITRARLRAAPQRTAA